MNDISQTKKQINTKNTNENAENSKGSIRNYGKVILSDNSDFAIVESYKSARTNLEYALNAEQGCKKIILTSAMPSEGKSTTSINLAITFALTGERVLLIDADLRKPKIHMSLNLENKIGFSNYLAGFSQLEEVIQHDEKHGFDVIASGQIPPNPSELLSSPRMKNAIEILSQKYDYIFVDAPPVNIVSDALSISKHATGVVIVVKENFTTHDALKKCISSLQFANARVLGFVLNGVLASDGYYSKYYKYKYKYKYGYRYGYGYGKHNYGYKNSYKYGNSRNHKNDDK